MSGSTNIDSSGELPSESLEAWVPRRAAAEAFGEAPRILEPRERLGRYLIIGSLGAGGMGVVYEAYDPELGRRVALKVTRSRMNAAAQARLLREAQALARIKHPNVIVVHDVGLDGGRLFIAMEKVSGPTLRVWQAERRPSTVEVIEMLTAAGEGLAAVHEAGLVHRDFKPENVLVDGTGVPRIVDFGLARALDVDDGPRAGADPTVEIFGAPITRNGAVVGTLAYMAPEQLRGEEPDARADVFSFCVVLYEALYGKRPFGGEGVAERLESMARDPLELRGQVPRGVREVLRRGLAFEPSARWSSMAMLVDRLTRVQRRRSRLLVGGVATLLGVGVLVISWGWSSSTVPCGHVGDEIAAAWNPAIAARTATGFGADESGARAAVWTHVEPRLQDYADRWRTARTAVCEERLDGTISDEQHDLQVACLHDRRDALQSSVSVIGGQSVPGRVQQVVDWLPALAACRDLATVRIHFTRPEDPAASATFDQARRTLATARAVMAAGELAESGAILDGLVEVLEPWPQTPLHGELARLQAELAQMQGREAEADAALLRRFEVAVDLGDRKDAALTAAELVAGSIRDDRVDRGAAEAWYAVARSFMGGTHDALVHATLAATRGRVAWIDGDAEAALAIYDEGIGWATPEADLPWTLRAELLDGWIAAAATLGRFEGMKEREQAIRALVREGQARGRPDEVRPLIVLSERLIAAGELERAKAVLDEAESLLESTLDDDDPASRSRAFELAVQRTFLAAVGHDLEGMEAAGRRALALADDPERQLQIYAFLGSGYAGSDRIEESIAALRAGLEAVAGITKGPLLLRKLEITTLLGLALAQAERWDEAERTLRQALALAPPELDPPHIAAVEAEVGLGEVMLGRGEHEAARHHLEAVRERLGDRVTPPGFRGNLELLLAQAIWGPGQPADEHDAREAREHARRALDDLSSAGGAELTRAQVLEWLAAHGAEERDSSVDADDR